MKLEVLLSTYKCNNIKYQIKKMNINSDTVIINQNKKQEYKEFTYKNNIVRYFCLDSIGVGISRNEAISKAKNDILLFADDDITYNDNYNEIVLNEFIENKEADIIMFNFECSNRKQKHNKKRFRIRFYNAFKYGTYNIAIKRDILDKNELLFNSLFGGNSLYSAGEDTLFVNEALKKKIKIYTSNKFLGKVDHKKSTWFKGYNEKYFFDKGALFGALNNKIKYFLILQHLIRHKEELTDISFIGAFKLMIIGAKKYKEKISYEEYIKCM